MNAYEIIIKKRDGGTLTSDELKFLIDGFVKGAVPDYQMAAFLMAAFLNGLTEDEMVELTSLYIGSGKRIDLSEIEGHKLDKHSTGGVGDGVSLILAPLVASCGVTVPMISGRGLGHTGGTLDKLESIPGFTTSRSPSEFKKQLWEIGVAIISQSAEIVPADGKIYALRDVTGTVDSQPLIVASIMSKKIAEGIDGLVMDVKVGSGAFMRTMNDAIKLAEALVKVGEGSSCATRAFITNMDQPLGRYVGNALEVKETIEFLRGDYIAPDMKEVTFTLAAEMLVMAEVEKELAGAVASLENKLETGKPLEKFKELIEAQGGDPRVCDDLTLLPKASLNLPVLADRGGYVQSIDNHRIGTASVELGAGRKSMEDNIDPAVGFEIHIKLGDKVEKGSEVAIVFCNDEDMGLEIAKKLESCFVISEEPVTPPSTIFYYVDKDGSKPIAKS
ncbi:thymidine phosphorylase [bacterium]|nr:thymidine phosphorylase [bacterium]